MSVVTIAPPSTDSKRTSIFYALKNECVTLLPVDNSGTVTLTYYGLVMPCGNIKLGDHWKRIAEVMCILLSAISQLLPKLLFYTISVKMKCDKWPIFDHYVCRMKILIAIQIYLRGKILYKNVGTRQCISNYKGFCASYSWWSVK